MNEHVPTIDEIAGDLYAHFRQKRETYDKFLTHLWRDFEGLVILIQDGYYTMPSKWYYGEDWRKLSYAEQLAIFNPKV